MKRLWLLAIIAFIGAMLLAGCNTESVPPAASENEPPTEAEKQQPLFSTEPVTLTLFNQVKAEEKILQTYAVEPVRKKYPFMTIRIIPNEGTSTLQSLTVAGTPPDMIYASTNQLQAILELDMQYDLSELIARHGFDLSVFREGVIDVVKGLSPRGEIYGFTHFANPSALFYNKDMFDNFAVAYPRDKMNWDEVVSLARQLTRVDNGVQYGGLVLGHNYLLVTNQLSLSLLDPATDRALNNRDQWGLLFTTLKRVFDIPGNEATAANYHQEHRGFLNRTVAMFAGYNLVDQIEQMNDPSFKWDMVSLPSFKERSGTGNQLLAPFITIASTSPHKDQAFAAIAELFGKDIQLASSKAGRPTLMRDPEIRAAFGTETSILEGKNKQAFFANEYAPTPVLSAYELAARVPMMAAFKEYVLSDKDINTLIREMDEQIVKAVAVAKGAAN